MKDKQNDGSRLTASKLDRRAGARIAQAKEYADLVNGTLPESIRKSQIVATIKVLTAILKSSTYDAEMVPYLDDLADVIDRLATEPQPERTTLEHVRKCINELDVDGKALEQVAQVLEKFGLMSKGSAT